MDRVEKNKLFISSCKEGNLSKVKDLVEQGINIHICNDSSIRWAAASGHLEIVKYLVEQGHANVDYPLRLAAVNGHLEVVKYLVEQGADIHVLDDAPLIRAVTNDRLDVVKYLVKHGADIHAHDNAPLKWAAIYGHLEVINYLRSVAGSKWKCFNCLIRAICLTLCEGWDENG